MSYSTKEFLERVCVSEATLRRWIAEGDRIPELVHTKRDWRGWRIWEDSHVQAVMRYKFQKKEVLEKQDDNQQRRSAVK
jgi:predicted site-specific integrase-resolvase